MAKTRALICPYCGDTQPVAENCRACGGLFEPLSRQATHNEMGPWFIRNPDRPFQPGCSYETLIKLAERGQVTKFTILRGPTTKQFWTIARRVPGVSHLLGFCHNCDAKVNVGDHGCHACGVPFGAYLDRNYLGLPEVRPLPWEPTHDDGDGRVGGAAASMARQPDARIAAEPLGISSFASDQELRGGAAVAAPPLPGRLGSAGAAGGATVPGAFVDDRLGFTSAAPESPRAMVAVQSAERKMAEMRRMIRMLIVGLFVWGVVTVIGLVVFFGERGSNDQGIPSTTNSVQPAPAKGNQNAVDPSNNAPAAASADKSADPVGDQAAAPVSEESIDVNVMLARAIELIGLAEQEEAAIDDRIKTYEDALKILREIDAKATPEQRPADLDERIKAAERALTELKLKAFFP